MKKKWKIKDPDHGEVAVLTHHHHQYHTAQAVKEDLESQGFIVQVLELETSEGLLEYIDTIKEDTRFTLCLLQREDHSFFYDSDELKAVYYTWTDRTRLRWVQPSHFTTPLPW